jgi:queuosine precursor transporter
MKTLSKKEKIDVLLGLYIGAIAAAELMGGKVFSLFGLNASVAIFVFPLTYTINDIIFEVEGKERAQHFMRTGFLVLLFLFAFTLLALVLPPAQRFQASNPAYQTVFKTSLRIIVASLTAFWLSERFDIYVFSKIRERLGKQALWLRNNVSNILSQFVDTALFMFLAFYKPGSFWFVVSLILPYWGLKCLFSAFHTPSAYAGVRWLKAS